MISHATFNNTDIHRNINDQYTPCPALTGGSLPKNPSVISLIDLCDVIDRDPSAAKDYFELLKKAFPGAGELHSEEDYKAKNACSCSRFDVIYLANQIVGGVHSTSFSTDGHSIRAIDHIFIEENSRVMGFGSIVSARVREQHFHEGGAFVIQAIGDPTSFHDTRRAMQSFEFWRREGARIFSAPYIEPPLTPSASPCTTLLLTAIFPEGDEPPKSISASSYIEMVNSYHRTFVSEEIANECKSFLRDRIAWNERVNLIPL